MGIGLRNAPANSPKRFCEMAKCGACPFIIVMITYSMRAIVFGKYGTFNRHGRVSLIL